MLNIGLCREIHNEFIDRYTLQSKMSSLYGLHRSGLYPSLQVFTYKVASFGVPYLSVGGAIVDRAFSIWREGQLSTMTAGHNWVDKCLAFCFIFTRIRHNKQINRVSLNFVLFTFKTLYVFFLHFSTLLQACCMYFYSKHSLVLYEFHLSSYNRNCKIDF